MNASIAALKQQRRPFWPGVSIFNGWGAAAITLMIWVLVIFMIVPEGFDYTTIGMPLPSTGSTMSRLIWFGLLVFGALVVLRHLRLVRVMFSQINPFIFALVVLAALSVGWSIEPEFSFRRVVRVITIVLDAMALVLVAWNPRRFQSVFRPILTLMLVGSIIMVIEAPDLAVERSLAVELAGAWHGLATQKNGLGSLATLSLLMWIHAALTKQARAALIIPGVAVSLVCLAFSRSSTSLMAAFFTLPFMVFLLRSPTALRRFMPYIIGAFALLLIMYSLAVLNLVPGLAFLIRPVLYLTGKDMSFSGRTAIWDIMYEHIHDSPWFGSGYGAYWIGPVPQSPSFEQMLRLFFYPTEAHNGYLDVINDLGAVGGAVLLGYLVVYLVQALRLFSVDRSQGALYLALLFEQLIANLSESRWFNVLCIEFVIMTCATFAMARTLFDYRMHTLYAQPARQEARPARVRGRLRRR